MLPIPTKFNLVAGGSEGLTLLNAFDGALLDAGAGNLNLLRVSSVLPPKAVYDENLFIPPGNLVPTAYGAIDSNKPGTVISAAVGVGIPNDDSFGMIMEVSGEFDKNTAEEQVRKMLAEAFKMRNKTLDQIKVKVAEHKVEKIGCAFAGVLLWY
jgi:arginine decarboxylase